MLQHSRRLRAEEVRAVMRDGARVRANLSSARFIKVLSGREAFAAVVPKKVAKTAVRRNQLRRQMYEEVRRTSPKAIRAALMLESSPKTNEELRSDLTLLLSKLK